MNNLDKNLSSAYRPEQRTSRLERMIERLVAQRTYLEYAESLVRDLSGPVLEIGLGKGRTYDYLRTLFPDREIFAFDRDVHAPEDCVPDCEHLILGDFRQTLRDAHERIGAPAALAHADIGSEDPRVDRALARDVSKALDALVRPGGLIISDREMPSARTTPLPAPPGAGNWPYYLYRVGGVDSIQAT